MLKLTLDIVDLLDDPAVSGKQVTDYLDDLARQGEATVSTHTASSPEGSTDFVKVVVPGRHGRLAGGRAPTLGVIGRLGGVGARPSVTGMVSDADGAAAALSAAVKLLTMQARGDVLDGDVVVTTHVCPHAPVVPHEPVPFMGSPVDMATMNEHEVLPEMDAILSLDATKGNTIINHRGLALSPTVKQGYILRVEPTLGDLLSVVTGQPLVTYPITTQDITPYGNGLYHLNSILQPATATAAPVVGVAITSAAVVAGSATGSNQEQDIAAAGRYAVEVAKGFGSGHVRFYDPDEFDRLVSLYGPLTHLQTPGRPTPRKDA
jgi:hypothetical protein